MVTGRYMHLIFLKTVTLGDRLRDKFSLAMDHFQLKLQDADLMKKRVVYPRLIESRDSDSELTLFINDEITLSLQPVDIFPDEFLLQYHEGGTPVKEYIKGADLRKMVYDDKDQRAAVSLDRDNGLRVEGIILDSLRIRPTLPLKESNTASIAHELFEVEEPFPNTRDDFFAVPEQQLVQLNTQRNSHGGLPNEVHPELFLLVDTTKHKTLTKKVKVAAYAAVTVAAANIRYSTMTNPTVRLRLCSVEIMSKKLKNKLYHFLLSIKTKYLDANATIYELVEEVKNDKYKNFDIVILLTEQALAIQVGNTMDTSLEGVAFTGSACTKSRVGIVEDTGFTLHGLTAFAHEVGHILGCPHDGSPAPRNLPKAPGSETCSNSQGFVMSSTMSVGNHNKNIYRLSSCCQANIRHVLTLDLFKCLLQDTHMVKEETKLPGYFISANDTCKERLKKRGDDGYHNEADQDNLLQHCILACATPPDEKGTYWVANATAPDGTPCSDKQSKQEKVRVCKAEECVSV
ncbi:uncharacterized protein LOC115320859 [Ixodes scapularis]|uniref:uncharacterized protein LOC115320859 n=1 Tax=Ixodes scapularis TaxID=6945 RepID=UPI001A9EF011|nr:uncharacterized protein LOC115320859 [Ixodes scapularis]